MQKIVKISAILMRDHSNVVVSYLKAAGVHKIYVQNGRNPLLSTGRSPIELITGRTNLLSSPVKFISCYVPVEFEEAILENIANLGEVNLPGMGSVYSQDFHFHKTFEDKENDKIQVSQPKTTMRFHKNLIGICCIVQKGDADRLARIILDRGVGVPTIGYGSGTGLREKLGLLRITIPAEKEVIRLVVSQWEAASAIETLIAVGRLYLPGRGFINTYPIRKGILDKKFRKNANLHSVSKDQIVRAIDSLSGGIEWRRQEAGTLNQRRFLDGSDINIICNSGQGVKLVRAAMNSGCGGATIESLQVLGESLKESHAREKCKMMITKAQQPKIIEAVIEAGAFEQETQAIILSKNVPKAFTYLSEGQRMLAENAVSL